MFSKTISVLFVSTFLLLSGCGIDGSNTSFINSKSANLEKLPKISCYLICQILFKFESPTTGKRVFVDAKGNISSKIDGTTPFSASGTGVLLNNNNLLGTAKHIFNPSFQEIFYTEVGGKEVPTQFGQIVLQNLKNVGLTIERASDKYFTPHIVIAWFVLPGTLKIPIGTSLENDIYKTPDGCYPIELALLGEGNIDLAIFKTTQKSSIPLPEQGFSIDDIADEPTMEKIEQSHEVVTWGYPSGIISTNNQIVEPEPKDGKVTATPNSSGSMLQTDIRTAKGASGSFVLSKKTGKVIGILSYNDQMNTSNLNCVSASYMRKLLKDASNNPATKKN